MKIRKLRSAVRLLLSLGVTAILVVTLTQSAFAIHNYTGPAAALHLTPAEEEYIAQNPVLSVLVMRGVAPVQYIDANGEVQGIAKLVLDEIAARTGLRFDFTVFDSIPQIVEEGLEADLILGVTAAYASNAPDMALSRPFLKSATILFLHKSVDPHNLGNKTYVAVKGGTLPPGIAADKVLYVDTREEALTAVNAGRADYGYGNAYSVAYYTLQNSYKNLINIPLEKEQREYCIGLLQPNDLLLSILNKAIAAIDADKMQAIILSATSNIEQEITLAMFFEAYSGLVLGTAFGIIVLLLLWIASHERAQTKLQMQNQRYETLAELSNEFLFEYNPKVDSLKFFQRGRDFFGDDCIAVISNAIRNRLTSILPQTKPGTACELSPIVCRKGIFRLLTSNVYNNDGQVQLVVGKLIDISQEIAEKEALLERAQLDGLTGLLNAATVRELVAEHIQHKNPGSRDAFLLLDADSFKKINDNLGHYTGDQVLKNLAQVLRRTFRADDIIARHGGDEFCVYMKNVPSVEFVHNKCRQLINASRCNVEGIDVSVCVGAAMVTDKLPYDKIFQIADAGLYQAKAKGPGQAVVVDNMSKSCAENNTAIGSRKVARGNNGPLS